MKEITKVMYEAFDGKIFNRKEDCEKYEKARQIEAKENHKDYAKLITMLVSDKPPIAEQTLDCDNWYFNWFKIKNEEELELVNKYIECDKAKADQFPVFVCIESEYDIFSRANKKVDVGQYGMTMDYCVDKTKRFFEEFGYEMTLTKKGEQ